MVYRMRWNDGSHTGDGDGCVEIELIALDDERGSGRRPSHVIFSASLAAGMRPIYCDSTHAPSRSEAF